MDDTNIWKGAPEGTEFIVDYGFCLIYYKRNSNESPLSWDTREEVWYSEEGYDSFVDWKADLPLFANILTKP